MSTKMRFTIGRSRESDIILAENTVSRVHAELAFMEGGKLLLTDCRSAHGTALINHDGSEQLIRQEFISPTDTVRFGNVMIEVKELLEAIRLKYPLTGSETAHVEEKNDYVKGRKLERCGCGAIMKKDGICPVCEQ